MQKFSLVTHQKDRELTVRHALTAAGLHIEGGPQLWELTTQRMVGDDGKEFLSASPSSQCPTWLSDRGLCRPPEDEQKNFWEDLTPSALTGKKQESSEQSHHASLHFPAIPPGTLALTEGVRACD